MKSISVLLKHVLRIECRNCLLLIDKVFLCYVDVSELQQGQSRTETSSIFLPTQRDVL